MPKPTGRNKTASPYARKQESRDVSTMGARPTELRPNKRESYQVATQVPKASERGMRTATPRSYSMSRTATPRTESQYETKAGIWMDKDPSRLNPKSGDVTKRRTMMLPNRPNNRYEDERWQDEYGVARRSSARRANDINREYRMDMLRDVARKKRGY